jgi:hypothetical protein
MFEHPVQTSAASMPAQPVSKLAIRRFAPVARGPFMARLLLRRCKLHIVGAIMCERRRISMKATVFPTLPHSSLRDA